MISIDRRRKLPWFILLSGLVCGTLDITAAFLWAWLSAGTLPGIILRYIAGGLVGMTAAFKGGAEIMLLGLFLHFFIAFFWTTVFMMTYPSIRILRVSVAGTAAGYGAIIWLTMNLCVLPLSALPVSHPKIKGILIGAGILMLAIGLPLALLAKRFYQADQA